MYLFFFITAVKIWKYVISFICLFIQKTIEYINLILFWNSFFKKFYFYIIFLEYIHISQNLCIWLLLRQKRQKNYIFMKYH